MVAGILMAAGVGLFGTLSGLLASWFLDEGTDESEGDKVDLLAREVAQLRATLEAALPGARQDQGRA